MRGGASHRRWYTAEPKRGPRTNYAAIRREEVRRASALKAIGRHHAAAVADMGGTLLELEWDRHKWEIELIKEERRRAACAPGCGEMTHVVGTNGGKMRCGSNLTALAGNTAPYFCGACFVRLNK